MTVTLVEIGPKRRYRDSSDAHDFIDCSSIVVGSRGVPETFMKRNIWVRL